MSALLLALSLSSACEQYECVLPGCEPCEQPVCGYTTPCAQACPETPCDSRAETRTSNDWVADLRSSDRVTRDRAVDALARMGPGVLADVGGALSDPDPAVRFSALQVFVRLRQHAGPSVWYVKNRVSDPDPAIRADAVYVISQAGPAAAEAIPELICALGDTSPSVRYRAAVAFQRMETRGEPALKTLEWHSRCDRDPRVREAARCAVHKIEKALCVAPERRY
jgi:HEAT repeat protein